MPWTTYAAVLAWRTSAMDIVASFSTVRQLVDGSRATADLLIGADGLRSTARGQALPDLKPIYTGIRCVARLIP